MGNAALGTELNKAIMENSMNNVVALLLQGADVNYANSTVCLFAFCNIIIIIIIIIIVIIIIYYL